MDYFFEKVSRDEIKICYLENLQKDSIKKIVFNQMKCKQFQTLLSLKKNLPKEATKQKSKPKEKSDVIEPYPSPIPSTILK